MSQQEISRQRQQIDDLFKLSSDLRPEVQAHWSRYLCVLVAGFIETPVQSVYTDYARNKAHPNVARYIGRAMQRFQNPNMQKILENAGAFSEDWAREIKEISQDQIHDSITSILANRHQIAHGKSTDLTVGRLKPWYKDAVSLIERMQRQCESNDIEG